MWKNWKKHAMKDSSYKGQSREDMFFHNWHHIDVYCFLIFLCLWLYRTSQIFSQVDYHLTFDLCFTCLFVKTTSKIACTRTFGGQMYKTSILLTLRCNIDECLCVNWITCITKCTRIDQKVLGPIYFRYSENPTNGRTFQNNRRLDQCTLLTCSSISLTLYFGPQRTNLPPPWHLHCFENVYQEAWLSVSETARSQRGQVREYLG
jgi:hypothetical protein